MNPLWLPHRAVVDRARSALARRQSGPRGSARPIEPGAEHRLSGLRQPDGHTCGSCSLVAMKMLRNPSYAEMILTAPNPESAFGNAALGVLRKTNAGRDAAGRRQLPWPRIGGTRPAAMVRLLNSDEGFGARGLRYRNAVIDPRRPGQVFDQIVACLHSGEPVPLYVGDHRWMQHIVLITQADSDLLRAYNPASGRFDTITRTAFIADEIQVGPWTRPWLAILPR